MPFKTSNWDADVPNFPSASILNKNRKKKLKDDSKVVSNKTKPEFPKPEKRPNKNKKEIKNYTSHENKVKQLAPKKMPFSNDFKSEKRGKKSTTSKDQLNGLNRDETKSNTASKKQKKKKSKQLDYSDSKTQYQNENMLSKLSKAAKIGSKKDKAKSARKHSEVDKAGGKPISLFSNVFESNRRDTKKQSLRDRMLQRLKGARFRYINEQLYLSEGQEAKSYFKEDPASYEAYHEGYRQQVTKWPLNPIDIIIEDISKMPKTHKIADFGCGDAKLAKTVPHNVKSFDLISSEDQVIECDMAHTPLLASEVDVAVFCLSLMGTNLTDYFKEANRVLKTGGLMKIAEVESRFEKIDEFIKEVNKFGFKLLKKDLSHDLFYFLDFKKEREIGKKGKKNLPSVKLKACLYKRR